MFEEIFATLLQNKIGKAIFNGDLVLLKIPFATGNKFLFMKAR